MEPALRQPRDRAAGSWQWARTAGTQRALLDAAREVFVEQGFADASIAEVVRRAGSSVGSLYHHFGGKSELFIALWQEHQAAHEEAASTAVAKAKRAGVTDQFELFSVGARAFLEGSWQRRDLAMLFFNGDSPPGFEVMKRRRGTRVDRAERHPAAIVGELVRPTLREHPDVADRRGGQGGCRVPATGGRPTRSSTP